MSLKFLRPLVHFKQTSRVISRHFEHANKFSFLIFSRNFSTTRVVNERRYSKKHEWISLDDGKGTVGISNYAQEALGDLVYCQLPELGTTASQNEPVGAVESVKTASDVYTPISGEILEVNEKLEDKPDLINKSPYTEGWIFKLLVTHPDEYDSLMDEKQYEEYIKQHD